MTEIKYSPNSNRLKWFDYSNSGGYFLTICTKNRENYFGEVAGGKMILNEIGKIVEEEILNIWEQRTNVELDKFVVMPNHVHLIILVYNGLNECRDNSWIVSWNIKDDSWIVSTTDDIYYRRKMLIPKIIWKFKMQTSKQFNILKNVWWSNLWQSNYYDRVIRNEIELNKIRQYILDNPLKRDIDKNNTENLFM